MSCNLAATSPLLWARLRSCGIAAHALEDRERELARRVVAAEHSGVDEKGWLATLVEVELWSLAPEEVGPATLRPTDVG